MQKEETPLCVPLLDQNRRRKPHLCPGCLTPMKYPKIFPCGHSICDQCELLQTVQGTDDEVSVNCLCCSEKTVLNVSTGLPVNHALKRMIAQYSPKNKTGGKCSECKKEKNEVLHCGRCRVFSCAKCAFSKHRDHRRMKIVTSVSPILGRRNEDKLLVGPCLFRYSTHCLKLSALNSSNPSFTIKNLAYVITKSSDGAQLLLNETRLTGVTKSVPLATVGVSVESFCEIGTFLFNFYSHVYIFQSCASPKIFKLNFKKYTLVNVTDAIPHGFERIICVSGPSSRQSIYLTGVDSENKTSFVMIRLAKTVVPEISPEEEEEYEFLECPEQDEEEEPSPIVCEGCDSGQGFNGPPKFLPKCGHSVCMKCETDCRGVKSSGEYCFTCPICQTESKRTNKRLATNENLDRMLPRELKTLDLNNPRCGWCKKSVDKAEILNCGECQALTCTLCFFKKHESHKNVEIASFVSSDQIKTVLDDTKLAPVDINYLIDSATEIVNSRQKIFASEFDSLRLRAPEGEFMTKEAMELCKAKMEATGKEQVDQWNERVLAVIRS